MSKAQQMIQAALARAERRKQNPQRVQQSHELRYEARKVTEWREGTGAFKGEPFKEPLQLHVVRVPLDRQGYTKYGQYFGAGEPVFAIEDQHRNLIKHIRSENRREALEIVREHFPNAKVK